MGLNIKTAADLVALSAQKQSDAGTAATIDTALLFDEQSGVTINDQREHNQEEKTGEVEPTDVDVKDKSAEGTLTMEKATPEGLAWAYAFAFNDNAAAAGGDAGNFMNTSKLTAYPENPPYFTMAHRRGGGSQQGSADFRRHVGLGINSLQLQLAKGEFARLQLGILGVGAYDDAIPTQEESAVDFSLGDPTVTLTKGKVLGDDKDNVTIYADADGDGFFEEEMVAVSYTNGTDALVIDQDSVGGTTVNGSSVPVRISYQVDESDAGFTWIPEAEGASVRAEFKLKAANIQILLGGDVNAVTPAKGGGQIAACEVEELTYELNWNGEVGRCWREGATESDRATSVDWGDPLQTITVNRRVRDYLFKQHHELNANLGVFIDAVGAVIQDGGSEVFLFEQYIPRARFLEKPLQVSNGKWIEAGNLVVLKKAGTSDPTCTVRVRNEVNGYL